MTKLVLKKKYNIIFRVLIILIVLASLGNVIYTKYEESLIKSEITTLMDKDFTIDNFNTSTKTVLEYGKVETAIKSYLNSYADTSKELSTLLNNDDVKSVLSSSNYQSDGPQFINTTSKLTLLKSSLDSKYLELEEYSKKSKKSSYISNYHLSKYYEDLYYKYINSSVIKNKINNNINLLSTNKSNIINLIDQESLVLEFLSKSTSWIIRDSKIIFSKEDDLITYNSLIKDIL